MLHAECVQFGLALIAVTFGLLNAKHIGLVLIEKVEETFFVRGADAVDVPRNQFHAQSLAVLRVPWQQQRMFARYLDFLAKLYPQTARDYDFAAKISPNLVSFHALPLPLTVKHQAEAIVAAFWRLRENQQRKTELSALTPPIHEPGNHSVLMSYDFHLDQQGSLRLIEINTNAALSLLVDGLHGFLRSQSPSEASRLDNPFSQDFRREILASFVSEYRSAGLSAANPGETPNTIAIVDHDPKKQKLFIEFAFYAELFSRAGAQTMIVDPKDLVFSGERLKRASDGTAIDLVYNRDTDFYLQSPETQALREAMLNRAVCLTPHPFEYRLMADKERLVELSLGDWRTRWPLTDTISAADMQVIERALIQTKEVRDFTPDELWAARKRWFFKPRRSHGGKAVYRGTSISRGTFQEVLNGDYLMQEIVPPPTVQFGACEEGWFKYDLRFFVYQDKIQLACARLYRGQMTNMQTTGGGVTLIDWQKP